MERQGEREARREGGGREGGREGGRGASTLTIGEYLKANVGSWKEANGR